MGRVEPKRRTRSSYPLSRAYSEFSSLVLCIHTYLSQILLRPAISTSGEPSKDCPDIADKLTLRLTFTKLALRIAFYVMRTSR